MRLNGWNYIPDGYGMSVDAAAAPVWLRMWFGAPLLDRFAYPIMVRRGYAWLTADEYRPADEHEQVPPGWRVELINVGLNLRPDAGRGRLRSLRRRKRA
jgi:hypothetical protein